MEIIHSETELHLVFEYIDFDLKKYIDTMPGGIPHAQIKVLSNAQH